MAQSPAEAYRVVEQRLGRPLTAAEKEEVNEYLNAGVTVEELKEANLNVFPGSLRRFNLYGIFQNHPEPLFPDLPRTDSPIPDTQAQQFLGQAAQRGAAVGDLTPRGEDIVAPDVGQQQGTTDEDLILQAAQQAGIEVSDLPAQGAAGISIAASPGMADFSFYIDPPSFEPAEGFQAELLRRLEATGETGFARGALAQSIRAELTEEGKGKSFNEFIAEFYAAPIEEKRRMQERLVAAGLLKEGTFIPGIADEATRVALLEGAFESHSSNRAFNEVLDERAQLMQGVDLDGFDPDEFAQRQYEQGLAMSYMRLWSAPPPPKYIANAAAAGINLQEFEYRERQKPEFQNSLIYQDERVEVEYDIARRLGSAI